MTQSLARYPSLERKRVVVTGGGSGIGAGLVEAFARQGAEVIFVDIAEKDSNALVAQLAGAPIAPVFHRLDLTDLAAIEVFFQSLGPIDVLVNNAGITRDMTFKKMDKTNWDAVIKTNLDSVFNMTKPVCDGMTERGWGRIVNISSVNGQKGAFGQTNYSAAKAGMHGFTKALALEVARKGVTVNTISPGYIGTQMVMAIPQEVLDSKIIPQIPMGRLGKPEEVAGLVSYLASDEAAFLTGANIAINGGQHMQ